MRLPLSGRALSALLSVLVLVTGSGALGHRWMTEPDPVSVDQALEEYRSSATPAPGQQDAPATGLQPTDGPPDDATAPGTDAARPGRAPSGGGPAAPTPAPAPGSVPPPPPGVYTWQTDGWEEAGFRRTYPTETTRIVTPRDARSVTNNHKFSQDHEEWFVLQSTDRGGVMSERRMKITFGPVTVDRTVVFDPPLLGVPIPHQVGARWQGTWTGATSGSYTGETLEKRTVRIGNEDVEVYVNELRMTMRGESEGEVITRLWYSPAHRLMVREEGNYTMRGGPGTYRTEYTITLRSTRPQA
ncbi:MAG TPA: hypothetical protein VM840_09955 [Actinomycetota bacterium]|nr:hypothetical protein [Actinomycetota bacterium]